MNYQYQGLLFSFSEHVSIVSGDTIGIMAVNHKAVVDPKNTLGYTEELT